jgi:pimeloyl-ACP methyl ester carboxylesterase
VVRHFLGRGSDVPYTLVDMADDAKGLLDHLKIESAQVVGASMGGMIAQVLTARAPGRVASLGLLMTSANQPFSALPRWRVIKLAFDPPAKDAPREARVANEVRNIAAFNGPNFLPTDDQLRHRAQRLSAGQPSPVRRDPRHRKPQEVRPRDQRADGRHPRLEGSNGANSQRPQPRPHDRGRAVRRRRRHGHDLPEPVWRPVVEALTENFGS